MLDHSTQFTGEIFNFTGNGSPSGSDEIDLKDIKFSSVHDSYNAGVLTITDGTDTAKLDFSGSHTLANFKLASDGTGGTILYDPPVLPSDASASAPNSTEASSAAKPAAESLALNMDGLVDDAFAFKPELGANLIANSANVHLAEADRLLPDAELQSLLNALHADQSVSLFQTVNAEHLVTTGSGHHDTATLANPYPTDLHASILAFYQTIG